MAKQIQGPSVERIVKELRVSKAAAMFIKQAMAEGKVKETLERARAAMGAPSVAGPTPGESPAFAYVSLGRGRMGSKTLYYTGKSFQIGSVEEFLLTHTSSRTSGSWRRTA